MARNVTVTLTIHKRMAEVDRIVSEMCALMDACVNKDAQMRVCKKYDKSLSFWAMAR